MEVREAIHRWVVAASSALDADRSVTDPNHESLAQLPEFVAARNALYGDELIASQLDKLVGVGWGASLLDPGRLLRQILASVLSATSGMLSDAFDSVYRDFELFIYSPELVVQFVAPLVGFECDDDRIDVMDDMYIARLVSRSQLFSRGRDIWDRRARTHAVVRHVTVPKLVGDVSPTTEHSAVLLGARDDIWQVVEGLHLLKPGNCGIEYVEFSVSRQFGLGSSAESSSGWLVPGQNASLTLLQPEFSELRDVVGLLLRTRSYRSQNFALVIRRFCDAQSRLRITDQIVDQFVAAESMFLTEDENQELSFRLSQRIALLLGKTKANRVEISRQVKRLYGVRSGVVHGSTKVRVAKEDIHLMNEYLRDALRLWLLRMQERQQPVQIADWDALVFGEQ